MARMSQYAAHLSEKCVLAWDQTGLAETALTEEEQTT